MVLFVGVGNMWADTFSAAEIVATGGTAKSHVTCSSGKTSTTEAKIKNVSKVASVQISSNVDTATYTSTEWIQIQADANYTLDDTLSITGASTSSTANKKMVFVFWRGAYSPTSADSIAEVTLPVNNSTTDDKLSVSFPSGRFRTIRLIKRINYKEGVLGQSANGGDYRVPASNAQNFNVSTIVATAKKVDKHTVTYDLNGADGTTPIQADVAEGSKFTLHDGTTGITAPENKDFTGWNDGTTTYDGGAEYTMGTSNVTLTAQWATTYNISYNKGAYGTGEIAGGKKAEDVAYTLSSERFTRAGYVQVGWALTDGGAKAYELGGSYTTDATQTFYPVWAETSTYVASFDSGEGCSASAPAGWTFANAGSYGAEVATADYECKFGENFPTSAADVVKNASYIAFAKKSGACATYDLGSATTVSAVAGTFYVGSGSERTFTIEYLAADGTTVLHTISTTTNTNWGEKAVNDATVVPNVKYIRINPAHAGSSYSWLVMKAFSVTYVDLVTKYNVTFDKNNEGAGGTQTTLKYAEGAEVTLPATSTFTAPTNMEFDAWTST